LSNDLSEQLKTLGKLNYSELLRDHYLADYQYDILCRCIQDFQNTLDNDHEVGMLLASFGQSVLLKVSDISYSNPSIIHFYGTYNGYETHLIQHINQLNFLLVSIPKSDPDKPAHRIGFDTNS